MVLVRIVLHAIVEREKLKDVNKFLREQSESFKGDILNYSIKKCSFLDMMNERDDEDE